MKCEKGRNLSSSPHFLIKTFVLGSCFCLRIHDNYGGLCYGKLKRSETIRCTLQEINKTRLCSNEKCSQVLLISFSCSQIQVPLLLFPWLFQFALLPHVSFLLPQGIFRLLRCGSFFHHGHLSQPVANIIYIHFRLSRSSLVLQRGRSGGISRRRAVPDRDLSHGFLCS